MTTLAQKSLGLGGHAFRSRAPMRALAKLVQKRSVRYALLATITAVGFGVRFYRLGKWSFWRDEMFSVGDKEDGFNYTPLRQSLSVYLIKQVVRRWGLNERNARLVPATVGALTVPLLYPLLRRIFDPPVALLAALLLALSPWHLYWSQNARFYTLLLLFYSLALFTFYLGLEEDRPFLLFASLLFLGLASRERLLALFFIPVVAGYLGLLFLLRYPRPPGLRWRNASLFFVPAAVLAFLFTRPYLLNLSGWMEGFGRANNTPMWLVGSLGYYVGIPVVALAAGATLHGFLRKNRALLLLSSGALVPVGILALVAPFHYTANRYGFITLTSWLSLASYALVEFARYLSRRGQGALASGLIFLPLLQFLADDLLYFSSRRGNRDDWKGALALVQQNLQAGDHVYSSDPALADFYLGRQTYPLYDFAAADKVSTSQRRVWIVEDMVARKRYPEIHRWLKKRARLVAVLDVPFWLRTFTMRVYLSNP